MAEEPLRRWAAEKIGALLQMPPSACTEIVENILAYDDAAELKGFLGEFAEKSAESKVNRFVEELFAWKAGPAPAQPQRGPAAGAAPPREEAGGGKGGGARGGGAGERGGRGGGRGRGRGGRGSGADPTDKDGDGGFPCLAMPVYDRPANDKRRIVIDAASGRYNVLTNCLNCGKVIVEEEGWGPCLFCGSPLEVGDNFGLKHGDDRGFIDTAGQLTAEEAKYNSSFERAKATKDRLLSYDRDAKKRTKVFDDATDWYSESTNAWLSERQREDAKRNAVEEERKKREEKRRIHAKIDIFGRTVISADAEVEMLENVKHREKFQAWTESISDQNRLLGILEESRSIGGRASALSGDSQQLYDKLRASLHAANRDRRSAFEPAAEKEGKKSHRWDASKDADRVEDEFSSVSVTDFSRAANASSMSKLLPVEESPYTDADDQGHCLTMHQPWASLLVHGFKRAEGRNWRTDVRGRLWIHAAGKEPDEGDIQLLEQTYRSIYEAQGVPMPPMPSQSSGYPTSVLLGCVDVEACWTNKEYTEVLRSSPSMPQEENDNDYVFWCLRPRRLTVPLRMGGDHKIWRLPRMSLSAAQRGLQPVRWPAPAQDGEAMMSSPEIPEAEARRTAAAGRPASSSRAGAAPPSVGDDPGAASNAAPVPAAAGAAAAARGSRAPVLDLWPTERPGEVLEVVERDRDGTDRDAVVLQNGFVHLVGFVPMDVQQRIVDVLREIGTSDVGFFPEKYDGVKVTSGVTRMYLGCHWNAVSKTWQPTCGNMDGAPVAELPKLFKDMYDEAVKRANREIVRGPNKKRKLAPLPEGTPPTLGVVNFYAPEATMQMHQDKTESKASIDAGYAVMGICIGDACELAYGAEAPSAGQKPKALRIESGDVYLFGGESRLLWHGVQKILPRTAPPSLRLIPGRLSVTLRVG